MKVTAQLNNFRVAPRKVRLLADILKGCDIDEAFFNLQNVIKRSSLPVEKLLKSAVSNAENNFGLDRGNLYILDFYVNEGTRLKRWLPRAFGRATPIIKRNSHVILVLEERIEGKNRKSKEQMEKERKTRENQSSEKRKVTKKEDVVDDDAVQKSEISRGKGQVSIQDREYGRSKKSGWVSKMFNRKSM